MNRIKGGESVDLVILSSRAIDELIELGVVAAEGIDLVGPLPADVQEITTFSAGVHVKAGEPEAAQALVSFFKSPAAATVIRKSDGARS